MDGHCRTEPRLNIESCDVTPLVAKAGREVVVDLEAAPKPWDIGTGTPLGGWRYTGMMPGPVFEARQGDTLVVRLTNRLFEATTIHWHDLRLPAPMDGTQDMQKTVAPGERFEYLLISTQT